MVAAVQLVILSVGLSCTKEKLRCSTIWNERVSFTIVFFIKTQPVVVAGKIKKTYAQFTPERFRCLLWNLCLCTWNCFRLPHLFLFFSKLPCFLYYVAWVGLQFFYMSMALWSLQYKHINNRNILSRVFLCYVVIEAFKAKNQYSVLSIPIISTSFRFFLWYQWLSLLLFWR